MARKIKWGKKELNSGKDSSGVSNIQGINGTEKGVKQGYTHGSLTKGLVAYYPMERGKGQIIRDAAHNNTGQIKGAEWTSDSPVGNHSLEFDGSSDFVEVKNDISLNPRNITISAWCYVPSSALDRHTEIVDKRDHDNGVGYNARVNSNDRIRLRVYNGSSSFDAISSDTVPVDEWFHYSGTYDAETIRVFVNGEQVAENTINEDIEHSDRELRIGSSEDFGEFWEGPLDGIRIYNRALSQPEIEALYNLSRPNGVLLEESDVPSQSDGGVSRWGFDGDQDTDTATDSWSGNDGSIEGAEYTSQRVYGSSALSFDGEGDYVNPNDIVTDDILNSGNEDVLTYSAWIKSDSTTSWSVYVGTRHNYNFQITTDDTYSYILAYDDERNNIHVEGNTEIIDGNWHHIVGIWDQGHIKLYVDGKLDATKKVPAPMSTNDDRIGIGGDIDNDTRYFSGKIDDVRIYNKALTHVQVQKLFKKGSYRISRGDTLQ